MVRLELSAISRSVGAFFYLQFLDLLTTVAFLAQGVEEGNPLVRLAMSTAPHPVWGLVAVKSLAVLLGIWCGSTRRHRILSRINLFYAIIVAWNLVALILAPR